MYVYVSVYRSTLQSDYYMLHSVKRGLEGRRARHVPLRDVSVEQRPTEHERHVSDARHVPLRDVAGVEHRPTEHERHVSDARHVPLRDVAVEQRPTEHERHVSDA